MNIWLFRRLMEAATEGGADGGGTGTPDPAVRIDLERRAQQMGWSPKDQWRGDPKHWVDADVFVKRGEEVMPLLQANNRKLEAQVMNLNTQLQQATQRLEAATESIEVLKGLGNKQVLTDAKQRRKELLRQQAEARRDNNTDLEVEIGEELSDVTATIQKTEAEIEEAPAARKPSGKGQSQPSAAANPAVDPAFLAWKAENPWFGTDAKRSAIATAVGQELRQDPANAGLTGKAFFDRISQEVNSFFAVHSQAAGRTVTSKVEGSNGAGAGSEGGAGGGSGSAHSWNDLPAEAKAACERQAARVVGQGRAFKDLKEWKAHYVQKYFE